MTSFQTRTTCCLASLKACALVLALRITPHALAAQPIINDVTQLNPIVVANVAEPTTVDEIQTIVRSHKGTISIGGGRFSMGGQTATEDSLHIDMRKMNRIINFSPLEKTITVQAGTTWRKIQELIDKENLSVRIMQTYANFTVGGSLSVNSHGRYVGQGPLIKAVRSLKIIMANGDLKEVSPTQDPELFYGCIGGYGGIGIIVEATLNLAENKRILRDVAPLAFRDYKSYFMKNVRDDATAVFHNADLYPPNYDHLMSITWRETDQPVTIKDRLTPQHGTSWVDRLKIFGVSEMPFGKELRSEYLEPRLYKKKLVVWRNYEASYDVATLEPKSRQKSTFVLQEYFIPVAQLEEFVPRMASIFRQHKVNVINVSIRHAHQDPGSMLAWARNEVFSLVIYYKQGTSNQDRLEVGNWTRELVDAAISLNGAFYLPYQIHATAEQFHKAYPRADEFFALKVKVDPDNRWRNKLWDRYFRAPVPQSAPTAAIAQPTDDVKKNSPN